WILGKIASRYIQSRLRQDGAVFYDGIWVHRFGTNYYVDGTTFNYGSRKVLHWPDTAKALSDSTADFWCHCFKPQPGMVILDIGAGDGADTFNFSRAVGPTGKVIAVEAHPRTFEMLRTNCRLNRLANVIPVNAAAMNQRCTVYIEDQELHQENAVSLE